MSSDSVLVLTKVAAPRMDQAFLPMARWEAIPKVRLVRADDGDVAALPTDLQAAWSARGIHLCFCCTDLTPQERDFAHVAPMEDEEAVGAFLDPSGERSQYIALLVNPFGHIVEARIENPLHHGVLREVDPTWHCVGTRVRCWGQREQWLAELMIPFNGITPAITPPRAGDRWTGNFYRIERQPFVEISAWQPCHSTPADLHDSEHFGVIEFGR